MTVELDELDIHNRQQLSALMDGELSPDEARFLLRRLQHDTELSGQWDRWQLCGEVLRGQATAPAPHGFADRIAQAIAAEPAPAATTQAPARGRLVRWGGGALAASVALVALFMARQQAPQDDAATATPAIAATTQPAAQPSVEDSGTLADAGAASEQLVASAAVATAAVASVPRRADVRRGSATRTQQAARSASTRLAQTPMRASARASATPPVTTAVAAAPAASSGSTMLATRDPFTRVPAVQARPWPRSVLTPAGSSGGALTTGYSTESATRTFYPFDPALPQTAPVEPQR